VKKEDLMKKRRPPKRRNHVVQAMMVRSQKAGCHRDKKKEVSRKACRGKRLASGLSWVETKRILSVDTLRREA